MPWTVHTLGSVDLLVEDDYFVEDTGNPPEERVGDGYVDLNDGPGARLAFFTVGEAPFSLDVICLGETQTDADEKRETLRDQVDSAINGTILTYEYQMDVSQPEPVQWRVIGGRVKDRWRTGQGSEQIFALRGFYVALCKVDLFLSKG